MTSNLAGGVAILLFGGLAAAACSHSWDALDPLLGETSAASGTGGAPSTASGTGGAPSTVSSSASSSAEASSTGSSGGAGGNGGAASSSSSSATGSSSSTGSSGPATITYTTTFAACNSDKNLDLLACEDLVGAGTMNVDGLNSAGMTTRGFVRFDLDGALAGKTIDSVHLRLTTASASAAQSESSGVIWQVAAFTKASLGAGQPAAIGTAPVGKDLGAVVPSHQYSWALPTKLVAANAPVFLSVRTSLDNGTDYWNDHGVDPPRLIVDYH
jgi:hypothetical protein